LPAAIAIAIAAQLLMQHAGAMPSKHPGAKQPARGTACESAACESCGAERHKIP
jgi:hypothetical protein